MWKNNSLTRKRFKRATNMLSVTLIKIDGYSHDAPDSYPVMFV